MTQTVITVGAHRIPLNEFPHRPLRKSTIVYRAQSGFSEKSYIVDKNQPYTLPSPRGSILVSLELSACVEDVFAPVSGRTRTVTEEFARGIDFTSFIVTRPYRLATVDHSKARRFGIPASASRTAHDLDLIRKWTRALAHAGFDGILYRSPSAQTNRITSAALFGRPPGYEGIRKHDFIVNGLDALASNGFTIHHGGTRTQLDIIDGVTSTEIRSPAQPGR